MRISGLWRTQYGLNDSPEERKLFQLANGTFPETWQDLNVREWLAKMLRVHARVNESDSVQAGCFRNYQYSARLFSNITLIPSLIDPFSKIDAHNFEDRLTLTFFLCEHLSAMDKAARLKVLWKEIHSKTFNKRVAEDSLLQVLKAPVTGPREVLIQKPSAPRITRVLK